MTTLDTLARSSAGAIHHSVLYVPVRPASITGAARGLAFGAFGRYVLAGVLAGIVLIGALFVVGPDAGDVTGDSVPSTTAVTPTTAATPIPESDAPETIAPESDAPETNVLVPTTVVDPVDHDPAPVVPPVAATPDTTTTSLAPDVEPPFLKIDSPADGDRFEKAVLRFSGRTEAGATVLASGKFTAPVASDGSWFIDLVLAPGANGVVFAASDAAGNKTTASLTVYFDEPATVETTTTTSTTVATWEFTANQKYGSCELPVPYDVFSGTTKPGAAVTIASPYGNGTTTANGEGVWSVKVEFPTAPYNETFVVSATDYVGTTKTFEFVNLYSG